MAKAKKTKNTKAESQNIRTGGIYFSNEINCQIKIDADAEEGKKLISCTNLFDGQELGEGGIEPTGTIEIAENGMYDVKNYANANVDVASYPEPTGTLNIDANGTYDVKDVANAVVDVPEPEYELAWENPQPTKSINTEIEIEMPENYTVAYVQFRPINNTDVILEAWFDQNSIFNGSAWIGSKGSEVSAGMDFVRQIKYSDGNNIKIGANCMQVNGTENKNFRCIPFRIYSVKNVKMR